jgi:hypothetical protein
MAGAGYKLFNTGDVLTAAQVNTYLNEQTVMVFADSAARTTALSGVLSEGMMSYLQDTDSVEVYDGTSWTAVGGGGLTSPLTTKGDVWGYSTTDARIPIGANNTVLTADSSESLGLKWAAPAGGGAMTFITGATLTAASTWNFPNDTFTSTYRNYLVVMEGRDSANNDAIYWHFRASGTNNSSSNVRYAVDGRIFDNSTFSQTSTGAVFFLGGYPGPNGGAYTATIYAPQVATYTQVTGNGLGTSGATQEGATTNFAAFVNATTQYDAMGFTMSGNSYTGTYRVYGLADA